MNLRKYLVDHPSVVTLVLVGLVLAHYLFATYLWTEIQPLQFFNEVDSKTVDGSIANLSVSTAGVAAMVGGFAGVVVIFGLSSDDERFRKVRLKAATSLRRNWMSVVTTPLIAAFGALMSAAFASSGRTNVALWTLEICVLLAAHGATRLVIVLFELVKVVHASDDALQKKSDTVDTDEFLNG